jgi:hypothetical protein
MRLAIIACIFSSGLVALAQDTAEIVTKVEAVKYPPLPRQARIQGDVRLHLGANGVEVISGHPLLVQTATQSFKDLGAADAVYHFNLVDPTVRITNRTVKRGGALGRVIFRALGMKTEKVIKEPECVDNDPPKNKIDLTKNPAEIWIYGSGTCVMTETNSIAYR